VNCSLRKEREEKKIIQNTNPSFHAISIRLDQIVETNKSYIIKLKLLNQIQIQGLCRYKVENLQPNLTTHVT
jgi:hypothetical protein